MLLLGVVLQVCSSSSNVTNDVSAATAMGQYLADACFKGQNMDTSICTCVQASVGLVCEVVCVGGGGGRGSQTWKDRGAG